MPKKIAPANPEIAPLVVDSAGGTPVVYFDGATNFGCVNGVVNVTLVAAIHRPDGKGNIGTKVVATADLRCNLVAAQGLRAALDSAIAIGQPPMPKKDLN